MKQSGQLVSHFGKFPGPKAFKKYILCHAVVSVILLYVYYQLNGGKLVSMIKHSPIYFKHQIPSYYNNTTFSQYNPYQLGHDQTHSVMLPCRS